MKCNKEGISIIKKFETLSLVSYKCPAGIWTIGWGHTGKDVRPGMLITEKRAEELLKMDLEFAESSVSRFITTYLNDNEFSALVSFTFNVGSKNFSESTLCRLLNSNSFKSASEEFKRWNKSKGKVLNGLTKRREEERLLFLKTPTKENLC